MAGRTKGGNLFTIVAVTILIGTEILAFGVALGWALGGMFELPELWRQGLMGLLALGGAYATIQFFRHAATVEPILDE